MAGWTPKEATAKPAVWEDSSNRCNYDEFDAACQKLKFKGPHLPREFMFPAHT